MANEIDVDEFIQVYIESSSIKTIDYNNETKKWTIKYNYNVEDDQFDSFKDMKAFLDADQFGNGGVSDDHL